MTSHNLDTLIETWRVAESEVPGCSGLDIERVLAKRRPGTFPIGLEAAYQAVEADWMASGCSRARPVRERPVQAFFLVVPLPDGGFEVVLVTGEGEVPITQIPTDDLGGVAELTTLPGGGSWWLVVQGEATGTIWVEWEGGWAPFGSMEGGSPRLGTPTDWLATYRVLY